MIERFEPPRRPTTSSDPALAKRLLRPAEHGAQSARVAMASLVTLLVMVALMLLTDARVDIAARVASPLAEKIAAADRVAYYVIPTEHEFGPSFRLRSDDTSIKLITHLVLPAGHSFNPDDDFAYGIRVSLETLDGVETWRHEVNIRTRQSKKDWARHGWEHENAFLLDDPHAAKLLDPSESQVHAPGDSIRQLTDDRLTRIRLPPGDYDRRLRISFVPREPNVGVLGLARAYILRPRPGDDRRIRELSLAPEVARDLVDHLTYRDWDQLSEPERRQKLKWIWTRLAAEGDAGVDYEIMSIYETGYRLPRGTQVNEPPLLVDPYRSLAINVIGPTELRVDGMAAPDRMEGLGITAYSIDGAPVEFERSRARTRFVNIPDDVYTLIFESDHPVEFTVAVAEASDERHWFIEAERPRRFNEDGNEMLEPDMRRIQAIHVGEDWGIVPRWAIEGPPDPVTRMLRFDVRVVHPEPWLWWRPELGNTDEIPRPELELCFYDDEGRELKCKDWRGRPAVESHFEGLLQADEDSEDALERTRETRWYAVSEPQTLRVVAPREATLVELRCAREVEDQRLIVRGYGYWPETETIVGLPFRLYSSEEMIWRYPPLDTRTWFPMRPTNYDDLQDSSAVADLHAQVRLQPRGPGGGYGRRRGKGDPDLDDRLANQLMGEDGWDPGPWVTLQPRGIHRRRSILEELDEEAARRFADRWSGSLFTEVWPKRLLVTDLGAIGPGAPELHWDVHPRVLGREIMLDIDGETYSHRVEETRGRWKLPVTSGRARMKMSFDALNEDYELWINRPVLVASPPVSRRRVVHELTKRLVFPLIKRGPEALTVNVVVYVLTRRDRAELALSVDGGHPMRLEGLPLDRLSRSDRSYTIDTEAAYDEQDREQDKRVKIRYVDVEGNNQLPLDVVTVQITLGEDVVPGSHEVSVELLEGDRVWVRAFHRGVPSGAKPAASWTEVTSEKVPREGKGAGEGQP